MYACAMCVFVYTLICYHHIHMIHIYDTVIHIRLTFWNKHFKYDYIFRKFIEYSIVLDLEILQGKVNLIELD